MAKKNPSKRPTRVTRHVKNLKKRNKVNGKRLTQKRKRKRGSTSKDRRTAQYVAWRKAVYARDNATCQRCGKKECYVNAHHIRPWALFPADRFDVDNGVTLCVKCHKAVHKCKASKFLDLGYGRNKPIPKSKP